MGREGFANWIACTAPHRRAAGQHWVLQGCVPASVELAHLAAPTPQPAAALCTRTRGPGQRSTAEGGLGTRLPSCYLAPGWVVAAAAAPRRCCKAGCGAAAADRRHGGCAGGRTCGPGFGLVQHWRWMMKGELGAHACHWGSLREPGRATLGTGASGHRAHEGRWLGPLTFPSLHPCRGLPADCGGTREGDPAQHHADPNPMIPELSPLQRPPSPPRVLLLPPKALVLCLSSTSFASVNPPAPRVAKPQATKAPPPCALTRANMTPP